MSTPSTSEAHNTIHPPSPRWTHVALRVDDIDATIDWYSRNTPLSLLARREDEMGFGAWLGHPEGSEHPFLLVISQFHPDKDPFGDSPHTVLGPFAHLGIELPTRTELEQAEKRASAEGWLTMPLTEMPQPIGWVFMGRDPDGNTVEFSFDQGVYATAREVWG